MAWHLDRIRAGGPGSGRHPEGGTKIHHEERAASGSAYLDMDYRGDWYHVRFSDHENTTQNPQQAASNKVVRSSIRNAGTESGMSQPHELTIITDKIPESKEDRQKMAKDIIDKNHAEFQEQKKKYADAGIKGYGGDLTTDDKGNIKEED